MVVEGYLDFSVLFFPPAPTGGSDLISGRRSSTVRKQVINLSVSNKTAIGVCVCRGGEVESREVFLSFAPSLFSLVPVALVCARSVAELSKT